MLYTLSPHGTGHGKFPHKIPMVLHLFLCQDMYDLHIFTQGGLASILRKLLQSG